MSATLGSVSLLRSFGFALGGISYLIRTQRNARTEVAVTLASPERHPLATVGKDVSAAMVLVSAIPAAAVGVLVLGPRIAMLVS